MKKLLLLAASSACFSLTSCYVDPYYGSSVGYSGSYNGGGGYSSSVFVSTGDARWAYDPYRYCYYDRYSSRYYDPYLYGYYPVGYCPTPVRGCPHPYNWSGRGNCPPPSNIRVRDLSRYDDRVSNYSTANYQWARRVSSAGSSSWMDSSQRSQLNSRSKVQEPTRNSGWMNGGFSSPSPTQYRGMSPGITPSQSSRTQMQLPQRDFVTEKPDIQPRNTSGGMFGGLDRTRTSEPRSIQRVQPSPTPQMEVPRIERSQPPQAPRESSFERPSKSKDDEPKSSGHGGGLRQFQR